MKAGAFIIVLLVFCQQSIAQRNPFIVHYGTEDGLPQKTVMNIVQDRKGFMWFSTWDGLCKFDGVDFYAYKIKKEDSYHMHSDRFDGMWIDKFGYIWANTYENEMYRFDPRIERFRSIKTISGLKNFTTHGIKRMPSGKNWLLNPRQGAICFKDSAFRPLLFNQQNGFLPTNTVNNIIEDAGGNTWLLTANGLTVLSPDMVTRGIYFAAAGNRPANGNAFFCGLALGGQLWLGADSGKIYVYHQRNKKFDVYKTGAKANISSICNIDNNLLLITTKNDDFFIFNCKSRRFSNYRLSVLRPSVYTKIQSCYIDRAKNIWLETDEKGVSKFSLRTNRLKHFDLNLPQEEVGPANPRFYIWEDLKNRLWVQPNGGGLGWYDAKADELKSFKIPRYANDRSVLMILHAGYSDRQGDLWISTRSDGLYKVSFSDREFKTKTVDPDTLSVSTNEVRSIMSDHLKRIWVATKAGKIYIYGANGKQLGNLTNTGAIGHGNFVAGLTYAMAEDSTHKIWLGTKGKGIYRLIPTANPLQFKISNYRNNPDNRYSLSDDRVYSIYPDRNQRIWIGTYGGGLNLLDDKIEGRFYNYKNLLANYPIEYGKRIRIVAGDHYGNIYMGTPLGLLAARPNYIHPGQMRFKYYERSPEQGSIAANDIYDVYTTKKGETYLASFGGGLNHVVKRDHDGLPLKFINYNTANGLNSDLLQQIQEDGSGNLWLITESAVSRFDPKKKLFETYYDLSRLIGGEIFSEGGDTQTANGVILLGYTRGIIAIDPTKLSPENFKPYMALTGLRIANHEVPISDTTVLKKQIDELSVLKLNHKQNFVSFKFAALDLKNTDRINYAYRLDGIDNDWVYSKLRMASYSNLAPGKYIFRVRSTNGNGKWISNEHRIVLEIVPAFWQTGWAMALYVLTASLFIFFGLRWLYQYYRLKDRLALEHEQAEMKTNFFTDVSHEIRTPLTMIVSPLERLLDEEHFAPKTAENLQLIYKNAKRMLRLVNQVLDLRKMESQLLIIRKINLNNAISDIVAAFRPMANADGIDLQINDRAPGSTIWADQDGFEKMIYNLLSNALKHTSRGNCVKAELFKQDDELAVRISDNGQGMNKELLQKLFSRFLSYNPNKSQPSTGIGLSIVKEIADRHHARIAVESTELIGSTFTLLFREGNAHFMEDKNVVILRNEQPVFTEGLPDERFDTEPETLQSTVTSTILVIEDDDELRKYLADTLQPYYQVLQAANAEDGLKYAINLTPDFILSDVMMPVMDGLALLKELRNTPATSHIPVVFLTARTDEATELKAYDYGAEAFMIKPFSAKVLRQRIKTILDQRQRLYRLFIDRPAAAEAAMPAEKAPKLTRLDEQFIKKIRTEIEKHIADSDYTVEELIATMPMSRTVLVKKLKSLTGQSPVEFMRYIKIYYAAQLMETENYSVKEVSHMVGIADTKYFAQRFKEVMGTMPSEYKARFK